MQPVRTKNVAKLAPLAFALLSSRAEAAPYTYALDAESSGLVYPVPAMGETGKKPIASFAAGDTLCFVELHADTKYSGGYLTVKLPDGRLGYVDNTGGFKPSLSKHNCNGTPFPWTLAGVAKADGTTSRPPQTQQDIENDHSNNVLLTMGMAFGILILGLLIAWAMRTARNNAPVIKQSRASILQDMSEDIATFSSRLRRDLFAATPSGADNILNHVRESLISYGSTQLPDGTIKPKGKAAIRERVLAARMQARASQARRNFDPKTPSPPTNRSHEPWELELADWFAALVIGEVNKELFPAQTTGQPFGPEHADGQPTRPITATHDDLSYKPNV